MWFLTAAHAWTPAMDDEINVANGAGTVLAGDFDGDGDDDLVVSGAQAHCFLGGPNGVSIAPVVCGSGEYPAFVLDANGDGYDDRVVMVQVNWSTQDLLVYYGGPAFSAPTPWITQSNGPWPAASGDLNADGYDDLVMTSFQTGVDLYYGSALGLSPVRTMRLGSQVDSVAVHDMDADGYDDLLTTEWTDPIRAYRGRAGGVQNSVWWTQPTVPGGTLDSWIGAVGEADGDGQPDLWLETEVSVGYYVTAYRHVVYLGAPRGQLQPGWMLPQGLLGGEYLATIAVPDTGGDGRDEMWVYDDAPGVLTYVTGGGVGDVFTGGNLSAWAIGDFDGDGRADRAALDANAGTLGVMYTP